MNKEEHSQRIAERIENDEPGRTDVEVLADEIAGLWAAVYPVEKAVRRAEQAERLAYERAVMAAELREQNEALWREFGIESDDTVRDIVVRQNAAAVRLAQEKDELRKRLARIAYRTGAVSKDAPDPGRTETAASLFWEIRAIVDEWHAETNAMDPEIAERAERVRSGQSGLGDPLTFDQMKVVMALAQSRAVRWAAHAKPYADDFYWPTGPLTELADRIERGEIEIP